MRRSASEIINNLQMRIARLEKQAIFGLFEKNPLDTVHGWFLKGLKDNRAVNSDVKMDKDNRLSGKFKFEGEVYQVSLKREGKDTAEYKITGGNRDFRQVDFELSGANDSKMSERNFIKRVVDQVIYRVGQESARKEVEEHQKMVNQERDRLRKQGRIARLEKQAFNFKDVKDFFSQRWVKDSFGLTETEVIKAAERAKFIKGFKSRPKILKAVQIKSEQGLYELLIDKGQKKEICYDDFCEEKGMVDEHFLAYIYFSSPDAKPVGVEVGSVDGKHDRKEVVKHLKSTSNRRSASEIINPLEMRIARLEKQSYGNARKAINLNLIDRSGKALKHLIKVVDRWISTELGREVYELSDYYLERDKIFFDEEDFRLDIQCVIEYFENEEDEDITTGTKHFTINLNESKRGVDGLSYAIKDLEVRDIEEDYRNILLRA
jgi:hypothetical protein